jgi:hypothetical protein
LKIATDCTKIAYKVKRNRIAYLTYEGTKMKNTLKTTALALALTTALGMSQAQANSINFSVEGQVASVCEITNDSIASTTTLDLDSTSAQSLGNVTYTCSSPNGFTRRISSTNNGQMHSNGQYIAYQLSHTGNNGLSFGPEQLTSQKVSSISGASALADGESAALSVTIPSVPNNLLAGTYTDQITIEVTAN